MYRNRRFSPDLLQGARRAAGYSQAELARLVGVSLVTMKAWESGRRAPKPATQRQVADALGLGFDDLEVADGAEDRAARESRGFEWPRRPAQSATSRVCSTGNATGSRHWDAACHLRDSIAQLPRAMGFTLFCVRPKPQGPAPSFTAIRRMRSRCCRNRRLDHWATCLCAR